MMLFWKKTVFETVLKIAPFTKEIGLSKKTCRMETRGSTVLFGDLDGPNASNCYMHDLKKHPRILYNRWQSGKSLMFWERLLFADKPSLHFYVVKFNNVSRNISETSTSIWLNRTVSWVEILSRQCFNLLHTGTHT